MVYKVLGYLNNRGVLTWRGEIFTGEKEWSRALPFTHTSYTHHTHHAYIYTHVTRTSRIHHSHNRIPTSHTHHAHVTRTSHTHHTYITHTSHTRHSHITYKSHIHTSHNITHSLLINIVYIIHHPSYIKQSTVHDKDPLKLLSLDARQR